MFQKTFVGKIKRHFVFNTVFFLNRNICEILWKNIVELGRSQYDAC
jgi:hypothetical protein